MTRITIDARNLTMYPPLTAPFTGATERMVRRLAAALADAGHRVDVVSIEPEEAWQLGVYWWPAHYFPKHCDVLIAVDRADRLTDFRFQRAYVFCTAVRVPLGGNLGLVERFVTLSDAHGALLRRFQPAITDRHIHPIPPGVDPAPALPKAPGRIIWCHSPDRGLIHLARMWPRILQAVPHATVRVTYRLKEYLDGQRWRMDEQGWQALEIERWINDNPETVIAGQTTVDGVREEQARAELCAYPMDPLNAGVGIHSLAVQECAAAGCALLLSHHEGLPEVFGPAGADFLALPVNDDDWVREIADILRDRERRDAMGAKARAWALRHTWDGWGGIWRQLVGGV